MGSRGQAPANGPVLIDSDILIWLLRGSARARGFVEAISVRDRWVPSIVALEVMHGCRDRSELRRTKRFLDSAFARMVHVSEEVSRRSVSLMERYALSHRLAPDDALIGAMALTAGVTLATGNVADYRFITGLRISPFVGADG